MSYSFAKLADDWNALTTAEKEAYFNGTDYNVASIAELQSLGEFRIMSYANSTAGLAEDVQVKAVHNDFVVLPKSLFGTTFWRIKSMTITENVSDTISAKIRYIFTKDLINYYTFDGSDWVSIDETDPADVIANGLSAYNIGNLTATQWGDFYDGEDDINGLGVGFAFQETAVSQSTAIDNLAMTIDMKGTWNRAEHMVDYQYGYTDNTTLQVQLLTDGNYKINYPE